MVRFVHPISLGTTKTWAFNTVEESTKVVAKPQDRRPDVTFMRPCEQLPKLDTARQNKPRAWAVPSNGARPDSPLPNSLHYI
jgi:hypothetical protein